MVPDELLGPGALLVAALVTISFLWRDHLRSDTDDRAERDRWQSVALELLERIPGLTAAVAEQTKAINEMDKRAGQRTLEAVEKLVKRLGT
jgi:hypothetical protein